MITYPKMVLAELWVDVYEFDVTEYETVIRDRIRTWTHYDGCPWPIDTHRRNHWFRLPCYPLTTECDFHFGAKHGEYQQYIDRVQIQLDGSDFFDDGMSHLRRERDHCVVSIGQPGQMYDLTSTRSCLLKMTFRADCPVDVNLDCHLFCHSYVVTSEAEAEASHQQSPAFEYVKNGHQLINQPKVQRVEIFKRIMAAGRDGTGGAGHVSQRSS